MSRVMRMRRVAPVLLLVLLVAGSVALAAAFKTRDDHRRAEVQSAHAREALGIVQRAVAHTLDAQSTLSTALGNLSGSIDAPTWNRLGRPVLANASASSVAWVERVGFTERQAWERRHGLQILQLNPQGRPVPAGAHADYLVVADIAARQPMASGVDLGVDRTRRAHMLWAARTGRPSATAPLQLLGRTARRGVVVYAPAVRPGGRVGWVMVTYRTHRLAEILKHRITGGTRVSASDAGRPVFGPLGLTGSHTRVSVGQRTWDLMASAPLPAASSTAAFILGLGLLLTLLVGGALLAASRREHRAIERADDTEKQMAEVLSMLGEGVSVFRADGSISMINQRGRQLLGVPAGEASISALDERWTWVDEDGEAMSLERLPAHRVASCGGSIDALLTGVITPDGTFRWLRCSFRSLPSENGPPYPVACSFEDVTAQREAEAALAASEERYRTVVDQLEEGVILQDADSQIVTCNDAAHEILGLTRDQLEHRSSRDPDWHAIYPDGTPWPADEHPVPVAMRTGEPQLRRLMGVHKPDGSLTWININARALRHHDGEDPYAVVCSFVEVTDSERQRVELEDAQKVAALGSWQVELSDPEITTCSAGLKRLLGHPDDAEMDGMDAHLVRVVEEDRPLVAAAFADLRATGAEQDILYRIRRVDDGRVIVIHARAQAERDHDGRISRLHGTLQDVTEQRSAERALRASEARFRGLAEHAPVAILETDPAGGCAWVNDAWETMAGIDLGQAVGDGWREAIDPADREVVAEAWERARQELGTIPVEYRFAQPGRRKVVAMGTVAALRDDSGQVTGLISVAADVTASREAERMRREAERHFRSAFQNAPIGVAVISLDGYFVGVNRAMSELTGYQQEQLEGMAIATITHPEDAARDGEAITEMLAGDVASYQAENRYIHAAGHTVWVSMTATLVRDDDGRPTHFIAQVQDVTERRRYEQRLQYMADHDPLTGLLNRRSFEKELDRHVARVQRYGDQGAVLVLDLDHFKAVNDTLGHNEGDKLIVDIAHRLRSRLRESDIVARLGGDEFAVLLPSVDEDEAKSVAEDLLEVIRGQVIPSGIRARRASASIGVVAARAREELTGEDLLVCADLAMYDAKDAGRGRVAVYATSPHERARTEARLAWVERIKDALENEDFVLHAQPIVDLGTGMISQYELLIRMKQADGDLIPPGTFLYIAERYDLIQELDRWVLTKAIELIARARAAGKPLTLEVNVSGRSLGDAAVLQTIERELERTGATASDLVLEITETAAVSNIPQAQAFGNRLSELGCRFALDDFGAGFGSFYYLKHLPFDVLKIDGEFIRNCRANPVDRLIIESVVTIARGMGKRTVAEFVQDDETVNLLREYGVDYAQGYHLGRPTGLPEVLAYEGVPALELG